MAVGGGHGLAASLRAARLYAGELTGIVSVADDGGSSGRLRRQMGIVPPGDLRKCLVALADDGALLAQIFEHRFESEADELTGHALGNLILAGLMAAAGDVQGGLDEAARLLGAQGRVVPAATEPVVLKASSDEGDIEGQTAVMGTTHIQRVSVIPADAVAPPAALAALAGADQIVIGPGSLFTSVLAALAVPGIAEAIRGLGDERSTWPTCVRNRRRPRVSTSPTTWPPWWPMVWSWTSSWPTRPPSPSGTSRCPSSRAPWPRPTAWPTTRSDWRPPWPVWSDRAAVSESLKAVGRQAAAGHGPLARSDGGAMADEVRRR